MNFCQQKGEENEENQFDNKKEERDGKNYTIGKIYRLRKLARNQMNTQIFGEPIPDETETVSFEDFLERSKNKLNDDVYQALQGLVGSVSGSVVSS